MKIKKKHAYIGIVLLVSFMLSFIFFSLSDLGNPGNFEEQGNEVHNVPNEQIQKTTNATGIASNASELIATKVYESFISLLAIGVVVTIGIAIFGTIIRLFLGETKL